MSYSLKFLSQSTDKFNSNKNNYIFLIHKDLYDKLSDYKAVWEYNGGYYLRLKYSNTAIFKPSVGDSILIDGLQELSYNGNPYLKFNTQDFNKLFIVEDNSKIW